MLGIGATAGALQLAGRIDDVARLVGLDPRRLPAESDEELVVGARAGEAALLGLYRSATDLEGDVRDHVAAYLPLGAEHVRMLGGGSSAQPTDEPAPDDSAEAAAMLDEGHGALARAHTADAARAVSGELALVFASLAASHAQQRALLAAVEA